MLNKVVNMAHINSSTLFCFMLDLFFIVVRTCRGYEQHNGISNGYETVFTRSGLLRSLSGKFDSLAEPHSTRSAQQNGFRRSGIYDKSTEDDLPVTTAPNWKGKRPIISETTLGNDTYLGAIVTWTNFDSKVLFIITCDQIVKYGTKSFCASKSNVYRSFNYGESFDLELAKFANKSSISKIYVSPMNRNMVYALDKRNKVLYRSIDEGTTYRSTYLAFDPVLLSFHPTLRNIILAKDVGNDAYISDDAGKTWRMVISNVRQFFWSQHRNATEVLFEIVSMQNTKLPTRNYSLVYSSTMPFHGEPQLLDSNLGPIYPNSLVVKQDYIYIQRKTSTGNRRLFVFYKQAPYFVECELPTNELHIDYHFLEGDENQVMLAALTVGRITNLYIASENGRQFSLVLNDVEAHWSLTGAVIDIHRVNAVPGTLIANQVGKGTVISYNNGGLWKRLLPPEYDENGKRVQCYASNCIFKLSLYVKDRNIIGWSPLTSSRFVPGVIIAQGTLVRAHKDMHVSLYGYISTDGGQSWKQGLTGRHIYRLLDHGSLFASIAVTHPFLRHSKNSIEYSCDEGTSWSSLTLTNQISQVVGVAAHPAAKSSILKIFGAHISDSKMRAWTIWKVNFSSVFDHKCSQENYTMWTAGPAKTEKSCILGKRYIYERRREGICCSYGGNFERHINISICPCMMTDFECDFGFKKEELGGYCTPTSFASLNLPINCPEGKEYTQSKGYIKIKGDKCKGGIEKELRPVTKKCPALAPDGLSLSVQKYSIALGKAAEIVLKQQSGFLGTRYTWDYGDGVVEYNLTFDQNKRSHMYKGVGMYVISVLASNSAGSFTAKTVMRIIERVSEVVLHVTKPAVAMEEATYTAELITHGSDIPDRHGFVHFAWIFEPIKTPVLSLNSSVKHIYSLPGTYEVEVRVFNAISVVSTTKSVTVFGDVRVLQLQFSSTLDLFNKRTEQWNKFFSAMVTKYLIKKLNIRKDMVQVDVSKTLPTIVVLYLVQKKVPHQATSGDRNAASGPPKSSIQPIDDVMHRIIAHVNNQTISFFLMGQEVRVLEVTVIRGAKEKRSAISKEDKFSMNSKRGLYIEISIGVVLFIVIVVCIVVFCKRKLRRQVNEPYLQMPDGDETTGSNVSALMEM